MEKHSSLLQKSVNYGRKKFYSTGPRSEAYGTHLFSCLSVVEPEMVASLKVDGDRRVRIVLQIDG